MSTERVLGNPSCDFYPVEFLCDQRVLTMTPAQIGRMMDRIAQAVIEGDAAYLKQFAFLGRLYKRTARSSISPCVRRRVFARDGHRCCACGATENLELDHITPVVFGGTHMEENLQTLCRPCNRAKGPPAWAKRPA